MRQFIFTNATVGLVRMSSYLVGPHSGATVTDSPRGRVFEFEDVTVSVPSPASLPHLRPGTSPRNIGLIEGSALIAGVPAAGALRAVAPSIDKFTDFYGEYGVRTAAQLWPTLEKLVADPTTRQAVMSMWDADLDLAGGHRDHPCTLGITFRVRPPKFTAGLRVRPRPRLNMTVHMRSNDVYLGWSNDVVQFSLLHLTVAAILGLDAGRYVHHSDSMHLYESNVGIAETCAKMLNTGASRGPNTFEQRAQRIHHDRPLRPLIADDLKSPADIDTAAARYAEAVEKAMQYLSDVVTGAVCASDAAEAAL